MSNPQNELIDRCGGLVRNRQYKNTKNLLSAELIYLKGFSEA